jgi:hypothetical protein
VPHASRPAQRALYRTVPEVLEWRPATREALARNRFARPLVRFTLSRLAGVRYDGTREARLALVQALPVVALRPYNAAREPH